MLLQLKPVGCKLGPNDRHVCVCVLVNCASLTLVCVCVCVYCICNVCLCIFVSVYLYHCLYRVFFNWYPPLKVLSTKKLI